MISIEPIQAFTDNYIWLLSDPGSGGAWVVDPGDAAPVVAALESRHLALEGVLVTHHHFDHVGGLGELVERYSPRVYGPNNSSIDDVDHAVAAGDTVEVLGSRFSVMEVPGHTLDHIAYYHAGPGQPLLFCGDTLFAGGCGRVFEGTPSMMYQSLSTLAMLPANTRVYCAHEYTLANLDFATAVEPDNAELSRRVEQARAARDRNEPTVPSELGLELATNPFLRCNEPTLLASLRAQGRLQGETGSQVFATVRGWKDSF